MDTVVRRGQIRGMRRAHSWPRRACASTMQLYTCSTTLSMQAGVHPFMIAFAKCQLESFDISIEMHICRVKIRARALIH